jgi:triosephosphate isomerase
MVENRRKFIIGGNWKSNGTVDFVRQLCNDTINAMKYDTDRVEVVVAPVYIHIASAKAILASHIQVGA